MKRVSLKLTLSELDYLIILLTEEVESGEYWGNKEAHYKRRDSLLKYFEELVDENRTNHN